MITLEQIESLLKSVEDQNKIIRSLISNHKKSVQQGERLLGVVEANNQNISATNENLKSVEERLESLTNTCMELAGAVGSQDAMMKQLISAVTASNQQMERMIAVTEKLMGNSANPAEFH